MSSGYFKVSNQIEFGSIWNTFAFNDVEGVKLSAGFRSFKTLDDRFRVKGKLAYGFKDDQFKYYLDTKYLLSYKPRISVGLSYLNDTDQLGSKIIDSYGTTSSRFGSSSLFSRGENYFLSRINEVSANINVEVYRNFIIGVNYSNNQIKSAAPDQFSIDYFDEVDQKVKSSIVDNSAELYLSFTPNRNIF